MARNAFALFVGLVFGLGLCLSGMYDPSKVIGFLDLAGPWDPSLALVMGGAIIVALPAFALARRRRVAPLGEEIDLPNARIIDAPLAAGAAIFGVGWGLSGVCPAPGIVDVGFLSPAAMIFVAGMVAGMLIWRAAGGLRLNGSSPRFGLDGGAVVGTKK
jgi:uncharacterized membrane protein YedE/YeeE